MIASGLKIAELLIGFFLDIFIRSRARREALKKNFQEFLHKSAKDSQVSADMHKSYEDMKNGPWEKEHDKKDVQ